MNEDLIKRTIYRENSPNKLSDKQLRDSSIAEKNVFSILNIFSIKKTESEKDHLFNQFWEKTNRKQNRTLKLNSWLKYAAIFIVLIGLNITVIYYFAPTENTNNTYSYSTQKGSISAITLSDGSKVWLNSGSELSISETKNQTVAVLKGEAFFDVIHNEAREFIVEARNIKIKDLGTTFNIKAYEGQHSIETFLMEGDLSVLDANNKLLSNLDPGELFVYENTGNYYVDSGYDPAISTAWMDGKFVFKGETLESICQQLEKWYNVDIKIEDESLKKEKFTFIIKRTQTIDPVLKMLRITDTIDYKIVNKQVGPDEIRIMK